MKLANVKFTAIAYSEGCIAENLRMFCTEDAMKKWANAQYRKYGDTCSVEVYEGVGVSGKKYCTYHA